MRRNEKKSKFIQVGCGFSTENDAFTAGKAAAKDALDDVISNQISVVLVFSSARCNLEMLLSGINSVVGDSPVVGITTAGEIFNEPLQNSVVVTVLASPFLHVRIGLGRNVSKNWENAIAEVIGSPAIHPFFAGYDCEIWSTMTCKGKSIFGLLFSPGNTKHADSKSFEILERLKNLSGGRIPFFGGSSADDWKMETNYILYGKESDADSLLLLIFETSLRFGISMDHGFKPSNRKVVATKVKGHVVEKFNEERAADVYAKILGRDLESLQGKHFDLCGR